MSHVCKKGNSDSIELAAQSYKHLCGIPMVGNSPVNLVLFHRLMKALRMGQNTIKTVENQVWIALDLGHQRRHRRSSARSNSALKRQLELIRQRLFDHSTWSK